MIIKTHNICIENLEIVSYLVEMDNAYFTITPKVTRRNREPHLIEAYIKPVFPLDIESTLDKFEPLLPPMTPQIFIAAEEKYGNNYQHDLIVEEVNELITALSVFVSTISRKRRVDRKVNVDDIEHEVADVYLMLLQSIITLKLNSSHIKSRISGKIKGLKENLGQK